MQTLKRIFNIVITLFLLCVLYYFYDELFEVYSGREIVIGLLIVVALIIIYFSLKPCFEKKDR